MKCKGLGMIVIRISVVLAAAAIALSPPTVAAQDLGTASTMLSAPTPEGEPEPLVLQVEARPASGNGNYRRAARLYGFAGALTVTALAGVGVGIAVWDDCSSSWICINPGAVVLGAAAIVGFHGLVLFAIAGGAHARAARRERESEEGRAEIGFDVRVSPNDAQLIVTGAF